MQVAYAPEVYKEVHVNKGCSTEIIENTINMRMEPLVEHHLGYVGCLFSVYTFIPFNLHNESFRLQLCRTIDFAPLKLSHATKRTRHLPMESQSGHNMLNV